MKRLMAGVLALGFCGAARAADRTPPAIVVQRGTTAKIAADWQAAVAASPAVRIKPVLKQNLASIDLVANAGELRWLIDGKVSGLLIVTPDGVLDAIDRTRPIE